MNENKLKRDGKVKYNTAEPRKNQMKTSYKFKDSGRQIGKRIKKENPQ